MLIYLLVDSILCPPKQRGEELKKIVKSVRGGAFEYDSKKPVKTDWAQYDRAQICEMINYLNNIRDLVNLADKRIKERTSPRKRGHGRPPTDPANVAKNSTVANVSGIVK